MRGLPGLGHALAARGKLKVLWNENRAFFSLSGDAMSSMIQKLLREALLVGSVSKLRWALMVK
jgi:hypothetical protein